MYITIYILFTPPLYSLYLSDRSKILITIICCKVDSAIPDIYLMLSETLDCLPQECIVLEDSENGIIAASRAKMKSILIPDIKKPSNKIMKLIFKEFNPLLELKDYFNSVLV